MKKILCLLIGVFSILFIQDVNALTNEEIENWYDEISVNKNLRESYEENENEYVVDFIKNYNLLEGYEPIGYNEDDVINDLKGQETYDDEGNVIGNKYDEYVLNGTLNSNLEIIKSRYVVRNYIESLVNLKKQTLSDDYDINVDFYEESFTISFYEEGHNISSRTFYFVTPAQRNQINELLDSLGLEKVNNEYHIDLTNVVKPEIKNLTNEEVASKKYNECIEFDNNCVKLTGEELEKETIRFNNNKLKEEYYNKIILPIVLNKYPKLNNIVTTDLETFTFFNNYYPIQTIKIDFIKENKLDQNILSKIDEMNKSLKEEYVISDYQAVNQIYHYGIIVDEQLDDLSKDLGKVMDNDYLLFEFKELKKVLEKYPEFNYKIVYTGGEGGEFGNSIFVSVIVYYDDIVYSIFNVMLTEQTILFVDKDIEGNIIEKAQKSLNEYFNGEVNFEIKGELECPLDYQEYDEKYKQYYDGEIECPVEKQVIVEEYNFKPLLSKVTDEDLSDLGLSPYSYSKIYKDNEFISNFLIVLVDKKYLGSKIVESTDVNNDINVQTESYDVPVDSVIITEDVIDEDFIKDNEFSFDFAYNLKLYMKGKKKFIDKFKNGVFVLIPIDSKLTKYKEGDKISIYHILPSGKINEKIIGEVVKIDGKLFAKFKTIHFSTFALSTDEKYTVSFETNGGNIIDDIEVIGGKKINEPSIPEKEGFKFVGWYIDKELNNEFDFDSIVESDTELFAKWEENNDGENSNSIDKEENNVINNTTNPQTNDNINSWILMLIISIVGFIFSGLIFNKIKEQ